MKIKLLTNLLSVEDKQVLSIIESVSHMTKTTFLRYHSHFRLNLRYQVTKSWLSIKESLTNVLLENPTGNSECMAFIIDLIKNGDAEPVFKSQIHSTYHVNCIPHQSSF